MTTKNRIQIAAIAAVSSIALALPAAPAQATDSVSSSQYYCAWTTTPWLCHSRLAGYKCFQFAECTGISSGATRKY